MPVVHLLENGAGNVRSLVNAVNRLGYTVKHIESPDEILQAEKLLFPGVGAFGAAMEKLHALGYVDPLKSYLASGRPFMGICVGLQSLCLGSEESPGVQGLGIIPAIVRKFNSSSKAVPHMGWNAASTAVPSSSCSLLNHDGDADTRYYFVHSYAIQYNHREDSHQEAEDLKDWALSLTRYKDETFVSSVCKGNIFATQFHPEKSGWVGLKVLRSFLESPPAQILCNVPKSLRSSSILQMTTATNSIKCHFTARIIACLDVRANDDGDLVVTKGDQYDVRERSCGAENKVRNLGKPVDLARRYFEEGADEITFLNITSFREVPVNDLPMLEVLRQASKSIFVPLTIGGGIRDIIDPSGKTVSALEVAGEYFRSGADKVSIGSDAVYAAEDYYNKFNRVPSGKTAIEQISQVYGAQAVVISVDPKRIHVKSPADAPNHHVIQTPYAGPNGETWCWYQCTVKGGREGRDLDVVQLVKACEAMGAGEILLNCMDKDGTNSGYDLELIHSVKSAVGIPVIASSGAGNVAHFEQVFKGCKVEAALAAGIFHRKEVPIQQVKDHLKQSGFEIRSSGVPLEEN